MGGREFVGSQAGGVHVSVHACRAGGWGQEKTRKKNKTKNGPTDKCNTACATLGKAAVWQPWGGETIGNLVYDFNSSQSRTHPLDDVFRNAEPFKQLQPNDRAVRWEVFFGGGREGRGEQEGERGRQNNGDDRERR